MSLMILGLGPGDPKLITRQVWDLLQQASVLHLRTKKHPCVTGLPDHLTLKSFDHIYESAHSFQQVYQMIVDELVGLAREARATGDQVLYAVPGHPMMGEATVVGLLEKAREEGIETKILAGLSFVEPAVSALEIDGLDGLQIYDALEVADQHHPRVNTDRPILLGQVYNRQVASDLKLALMAIYPDEHPVQAVHAAGTADELIESLALYEIDRSPHWAHLSTLFVPPRERPSTLPALAETVAILRGPKGCPWDQEQTRQSLRPGFLEECSEVLDAIDRDDSAALQEELGDVLFHVVMQAQISAELGDFQLGDLIAGIYDKLHRRHPHVWGDWKASDSQQVVVNWEHLKANEKTSDQEASILDNLPLTFPALVRAQKMQDRVSRIGFDWPTIAGVKTKLSEELAELAEADDEQSKSDEMGDVLFVLANMARWLGVDAETSLREACLRFDRRFRVVERISQERELDLASLGLDVLDGLWEEAKNEGT